MPHDPECGLRLSAVVRFPVVQSPERREPALRAGQIQCEVWLDDRQLGDGDSAAYVVCEGSVFQGNGNPSSFASYSGESFLGDAQRLMDKDELDEALARVEKTIALAPNFPMAYYFQGLVYTKMEKLDLALEAYGQRQRRFGRVMNSRRTGQIPL